MQKLHKNTSGFTGIEALLIILTLVIIGFGGYYVWNSQKDKDVVPTNSSTQTTESSTSEKKQAATDKAANWLKFSPDSGLFTIKLPDGWTFLHQNDDCDCLYSKTTEFKAGTPAVVEKTQGGRDGILGYFVVADEDDKSGERFQNFQKQGTIKAGDVEGVKYYYEQTTESEGMGLEKGGKEYAYYFIKNGQGIYISYSINPGAPNNIELVEKSIETLR